LDVEILEQAEIEKMLGMLEEKVKSSTFAQTVIAGFSEINSLYVTEHCLIAYLHQLQ